MSNLMVFAIVVFLLLWLVSTFYTIVISSPYKRDDNVNFGEMDIDTLKQLIKDKLEYPYCKSIRTNEDGNLDIEAKYATYSVEIKEGKLIIRDKYRPFSKSANIVEEKDCLESYLVKILLPETDVNPPKAFGHFKRYIKFRILKKISGWSFLILLILYGLNEQGISVTDIMDIWKSKGVSQMCFTDYSEDITIGEALKKTCTKGKWSSNKIGDGLYHVTFSGYGANGDLLTILFQTNLSDCSIKSIVMADEDITWLQGFLLEAIYENAMSGKSDELPEISGENIPVLNATEFDKKGFSDESTESVNEDISAYTDAENKDLHDSEVQGESNVKNIEHLFNDGNYDSLDDLLDEVVASRGAYGKDFHWEKGENEDSSGADVSILIEESMDVLMLIGNCWYGADENEYMGRAVCEYDDGSIEFEDENGERLLMYMLEDGGMCIEDYTMHIGATFTGTYY